MLRSVCSRVATLLPGTSSGLGAMFSRGMPPAKRSVVVMGSAIRLHDSSSQIVVIFPHGMSYLRLSYLLSYVLSYLISFVDIFYLISYDR